MPAPKPTPARKAPPKPKVAKKPVDGREIVYPTLTVNGVPIPDDALVIDEAKMKSILGWEPEDEYKARMKAEKKVKEEKAGYGDDFLLYDSQKRKVRCHRNLRNRPFDELHAHKIAQDHLNGVFMFNCETIIISQHADTTSGQHRGVGLIIACEEWRKNPKSYPAWPDGPPVMRSLVVFGADDSPEVLRTVDNVKPRSLADVFYTSPLFEKMDPAQRKECSRMMDFAVDLLWNRLALGKVGGVRVYQTHSASIEFADTHPSIKKAVAHVFEENKDHRSISSLSLSAGHVAAMQYLMAASGNDDAAEDYFAAFPRTEKNLNLDKWDDAEEFVSELAAGTEGKLSDVVEALGALFDADGTDGVQGRTIEKLAVLSKAWCAWRDNGEVGVDDVNLTDNYVQDEKTKAWSFIDEPTVGGIDRGSGKTGADRKLEEEAIEKAKEAARVTRQTAQNARATGKAKAAGPVTTPEESMAAELKRQFNEVKGGREDLILLVKSDAGNYAAWMDDAAVVAEAAHDKAKEHPGSKLPQYIMMHKDFEAVVGRLQRAGRMVAVAVADKATRKFTATDVPMPEEKPPVEMKADMSKPIPVPAVRKPSPKPGLRGGTN